MMVQRHGFWWPNGAEAYGERYIRRAPDMGTALQFVRRRRSVVQAGGHVGVWPQWLSERFAQVYTFELESANYDALCRNVTAPNVAKQHAALGYERGMVGVHRHARNIGGHSVQLGPADVPMVRVDDLGLDDCDLIVLDIEGYEYEALRGAADTLHRCRPVVMWEDMGHGAKKHGFGPESDVPAWLTRAGYREVATVRHDRVWAPC